MPYLILKIINLGNFIILLLYFLINIYFSKKLKFLHFEVPTNDLQIFDTFEIPKSDIFTVTFLSIKIFSSFKSL